jgi:hypothetical protein
MRYCFCGAPSLTRGRVCLLYMLLLLDSAVFLGSECLGTRDHIWLSQICDFPFRRDPTTRRVTVEVFKPRLHTGLPWNNSVTIAAERTRAYSKHISRDRYPSSLLPRPSYLQKAQLPLLLRVGSCLQSYCLATHWPNLLHYCIPDIKTYWFVRLVRHSANFLHALECRDL